MTYNHGSNAYELEERHADRIRRHKDERHLALLNRARNRRKTWKNTGFLLMIGLCASFMISKYVAVDDTQKRIDELNAELSQKQTYTSEKTFELEQKVSLTKIEEEAMTRLGMQRPEKTQIIYVDIKKDDYTEVTSNEVEGMKNKLSSSLKNTKQTLINIFTLR